MPADLRIRRLKAEERVSFSCDDEDLNDFFVNEWPQYRKKLLAVTYVLENSDEVIAMFSLSNDRLDVHDFGDDGKPAKKALVKAAKLFPHPTRLKKDFPAVKIGRLAVRSGYTGQRIGRFVIAFIQAFFLYKNKTGCAFITVDAYPGAIGFYEKVGFIPVQKRRKIPDDSPNPNHCFMYMSLLGYADSDALREFLPCVEQLLSNEMAVVSIADGAESLEAV